jgi:putative oxidoreductase
MTIAWALLLLRVMLGGIMVAHGLQKLLGWFDGPGYQAVQHMFGALGFQPARLWVWLTLLGELGGGFSVVFGLLTPLGAAGILGVMVMAVRTHWKSGFFALKGGFEYPLALALVSIVIGIAGPGAYALDPLLKIALPEVALFAGLALAAVLVDIAGIAISRANTAKVAASAPQTAS